MKHLDDEALKALERGDPAARSYFAEHLSTPCEVCEAFLEKSHALNGAVDSLLLGHLANKDAALDEVGYARVRRGLRKPRLHLPSAGWSALAAGLAVVLGVGVWQQLRQPSPDHWDGVKGGSVTLSLELEGAVQSPAGELHRLDPGAQVPPDGALVLRYHATDRAQAWLFKETDGKLEALGSFALEPGPHTLTLQGGGAAALPLDEEAGKVRVWLVGAQGERMPSLDEAREAVLDPSGKPLATAHLDVQVGGPGR